METLKHHLEGEKVLNGVNCTPRWTVEVDMQMR